MHLNQVTLSVTKLNFTGLEIIGLIHRGKLKNAVNKPLNTMNIQGQTYDVLAAREIRQFANRLVK